MNRYNIVGYTKMVELKADVHKFSKYLQCYNDDMTEVPYWKPHKYLAPP